MSIVKFLNKYKIEYGLTSTVNIYRIFLSVLLLLWVLRPGHPDNLSKDGVCLYYKENLSLRQIETPYFSSAYSVS